MKPEFRISVNQVEELQMIGNVDEIERILDRARSIVVQGGEVILVRQNPDGRKMEYDRIHNEHDLSNYRKTVLKYLS